MTEQEAGTEGAPEVPTAGDLRELVESLAKQRALAAGLKLGAAEVEKAIQATAEWKAWTDAQTLAASAGMAAKTLEAKVRVQALALARMSGTKEPAPGVTVTRLTVFSVTDNRLAAEWARVNAPLTLRVDEDRLAKAVLDLPPDERQGIPGVNVDEREYGQVRIDRDLGPIYLKE